MSRKKDMNEGDVEEPNVKEEKKHKIESEISEEEKGYRKSVGRLSVIKEESKDYYTEGKSKEEGAQMEEKAEDLHIQILELSQKQHNDNLAEAKRERERNQENMDIPVNIQTCLVDFLKNPFESILEASIDAYYEDLFKVYQYNKLLDILNKITSGSYKIFQEISNSKKKKFEKQDVRSFIGKVMKEEDIRIDIIEDSLDSYKDHFPLLKERVADFLKTYFEAKKAKCTEDKNEFLKFATYSAQEDAFKNAQSLRDFMKSLKRFDFVDDNIHLTNIVKEFAKNSTIIKTTVQDKKKSNLKLTREEDKEKIRTTRKSISNSIMEQREEFAKEDNKKIIQSSLKIISESLNKLSMDIIKRKESLFLSKREKDSRIGKVTHIPKDFFKPITIFLQDINQKFSKKYTDEKIETKNKQKMNMLLISYFFIVFAYPKNELIRIFFDNFYTQFDSDQSFKLEETEFIQCIDYIAKIIENHEFMKNIFENMGVIVNELEAVKGSEFDVSIYSKAFKKMSSNEKTEKGREFVTLKKFLPYFYIFFIEFEIKSLEKRKILYKKFEKRIDEAYIKVFENKKSILPPKNSQRIYLNDEMPSTYSEEEKARIKNKTEKISYKQIREMLTIIESQNYDEFGNDELHCINKELLGLLKVDPITETSEKKVSYTTDNSNKFFKIKNLPMMKWEKQPEEPNFSMRRFLCYKMTLLAMCKDLVKRSNIDLLFIREEKMLLFNEMLNVLDSEDFNNSLKSYLMDRFEKEDKIKVVHGSNIKFKDYKNVLAEFLKAIFPGFDPFDAELLIIHAIKLKENKDKKEEKKSDEINPKSYKIDMTLHYYLLNNISRILPYVSIERFYFTYLTLTDTKVQSISNIFHNSKELFAKKNDEETHEFAKKDIKPSMNMEDSIDDSPKDKDENELVEDEPVEAPFYSEPTVYEGITFKPKKKKQNTSKIVDTSQLIFSIENKNDEKENHKWKKKEQKEEKGINDEQKEKLSPLYSLFESGVL